MLFSLIFAVFALFMLFYGAAFSTFFIIVSAALVPYLLFKSTIALVLGLALALLFYCLRKILSLAVFFALLVPFAFFPSMLTLPSIAVKLIIGILLSILVYFRPPLFRFVSSLFASYIIAWLFTGLYYLSRPFSLLLFSVLFLLSLIPGRKKKEV